MRRPGKISEMEERGEGRAAQDKEMAQQRTRRRLWDWAMDEAGRQESEGWTDIGLIAGVTMPGSGSG